MASKKTQMERQKSKLIYDFLPGNTFNHAHCGSIGRVKKIKRERDEHGQPTDPDLPEQYVMRRVYRHLSKWTNSDDIQDDIDAEVVEFINPGKAKFYLFPRQFECSNGTCRSVNEFDRDEIDWMANEHVDTADALSCENCGMALSDRDQLGFIAVCECGAIEKPYVPSCCGVGMQFHRRTTQPSNWFWRCAKTDCTEGDNGGRNQFTYMATNTYCPDPTCDNEDMDVINHTDNSAFYAQVCRLVNVSPARENVDALDNIFSDEPSERAKITSDYLLHGTDRKPSQQEKMEKAAEILGGRDAYFEVSDDRREAAEQQAEELLMTDVVDHREDLQQFLEHDYEFDSKRLAEELYEYLSIVGADGYQPKDGLKAVSYEEMRKENAENTHLSLPKVREYINLRNDLNFSEVRLVKNFPITTITYGYTRINAQPPGEDRTPGESDTEREGREGEGSEGDDDETEEEREVQLNLFREGNYSAPQFYCQTNDAEAVFIRLDRGVVLDWLEENNVVGPEDTPNRDDEEAVRRWFIENVRKPGRYESLSDSAMKGSSEKISRHCHTLINTTAHLFINAMGVLAGHQHESLVEHLMPRIMSFVVYKRPDTSFVLGSLWTLFEEQFGDFTGHLDELNDCSYDPVCRHDENGACEDCLYLAAISTENVNKNLGRSLFYGGPFDGQQLTGFREM